MFVQIISLLAQDLLRNESEGTLQWATVQEWISIYSNRQIMDRTLIGRSAPPSDSAGYVELVRENRKNAIRVHATVVFDTRSGPVAAVTWEARKIDDKLEETFADGLRIRLKIE